MAMDDRLFAPFSIEMDEHPKIAGLSDAAFRAIFEAIFYSRRMLSDGFLDKRIVLRRWGQEVAEELASNDDESPSWISMPGGWQIHDFEKHHPLRADVQEKRAETSKKRSESGKKGAEARWRGKHEADAWQDDGKRIANDGSETQTETETQATTPNGVESNPGKPDVRVTPEHRATDAAYSQTGKAFNFIAVRAMAKWALSVRGKTEAEITEAIVAAYNAGKPITKTVLGQHFDGITGQRNTKPTPEQRARQTMALAMDIDMKEVEQ